MTEKTYPIGFKKDDLVILPSHIIPNRSYRRGAPIPPSKVGLVLRVIDAEESPLGSPSLMIQICGGHNYKLPYGVPFIINAEEVTRFRLHPVCDTCTCALPELENNRDSSPEEEFDEEEEEDD